MFCEEPITPERPDPPLETPDLSLVSAEDLVDELASRFPDGCVIALRGTEEGNRPYVLRYLRGHPGALFRLLRQARGRIKRLCGE